MKGQPRGSSPHYHVPMHQPPAPGAVCAAGGAKQKHRRQPQGQRDDGLAQVLLVFVLVQREFGAGRVLIDQAGVGLKVGVTRLRCGALGQVHQALRHGGPGLTGGRVMGGIAVAAGARHPAQRAAVAHGHRHGVATGGLPVAQGGLLQHRLNGLQQRSLLVTGKTMQQHRAGRQRCQRFFRGQAVKQVHGYCWRLR